MPIIAFSSPKGGSGKTTAACILASVLAEGGAIVSVIDADPNKNIADWAALPGCPANLSVVKDVTEETLMDRIDEEAAKSQFVIIDLEGTASLMMGNAISMSDFVIIPVQGSQLDAKQAARTITLIKGQGRSARRTIPFAVLFTRTSPALTPRTFKHIEQSFEERSIPVFKTRLTDREAYRAIFSYGGTVPALADKGVSGLTAAVANAIDFAGEVISRLREGRAQAETQQVA